MSSVHTLFRRFESDLRMSLLTVGSIRYRYRQITRRINLDFWGSGSETLHSLYVGSYGRGTAISTSDIDVIVELPSDLYLQYLLRFLGTNRNGPSELLQKVRISLTATYPTTKLRGDGQVVVVEFSDGVKFEIVPVFGQDATTCIYPDTQGGGSWPTMQPRVEIEAFNDLNRTRPGGLKKFCRMLRAWNREHSSWLSGEAIDAMAYEYWETSNWADEAPFLYFDFHTRDFFEYWARKFDRGGTVRAQGTNRLIQVSGAVEKVGFLTKIHEIAETAIKYEKTDPSGFWRIIYGDQFPKT